MAASRSQSRASLVLYRANASVLGMSVGEQVEIDPSKWRTLIERGLLSPVAPPPRMPSSSRHRTSTTG